MSSFQKEKESQGMGMTWLGSHIDFMSKLSPEPGIPIATLASPARLLCFPCTSPTLFILRVSSLHAQVATTAFRHLPWPVLHPAFGGMDCWQSRTSRKVFPILRSPIVLLFFHINTHPLTPASQHPEWGINAFLFEVIRRCHF